MAQEAHLISEQHSDLKGQGYALRTLAFSFQLGFRIPGRV